VYQAVVVIWLYAKSLIFTQADKLITLLPCEFQESNFMHCKRQILWGVVAALKKHQLSKMLLKASQAALL